MQTGARRTWDGCEEPPPELLAHRRLLLGRRVRRRGRGPAVGEERAAREAHDVGDAHRRERVCVQQIREEAREEGRERGEREGERVCEREFWIHARRIVRNPIDGRRHC